MTTLAVIDAHALLWIVLDQRRRLGRNALRLLERVEQGHASLQVPTVALMEISEAAWKGRVTLEGGFDTWLDRTLSTGNYHVADLTLAIIRRADSLYAIPERGDRLIAATAAEMDLPLITRDPEIASVAGVEVIW